MWSLQNLLFILFIALRCVTSEVSVIHVTGYVGREVNISCSYKQGYDSYEKYLCKNDCGGDDVLVTTSNSMKNKYTIHDDKTARNFTTTISDLHSTDAGKYWCGVTRTGKDLYTAKVELKLVQDSCCDTVTKIQSYEGYSESLSCPYEPQYQNSLKYICRGNRPSTCLQQALITSDTKQNGRFRLDDDKVLGTFTVNISGLTLNDSGSYLCGVQRNFDHDVFSAVELKIEVLLQHNSTVTSGTTVETLGTRIPDAALYVVYAVPAALLLMCVILIVYKYRCLRESGDTMNKDTPKTKRSKEVMGAAGNRIYANHEVVLTYTNQGACSHHKDSGRDEEVYENMHTTEEIYCNDIFHNR